MLVVLLAILSAFLLIVQPPKKLDNIMTYICNITPIIPYTHSFISPSLRSLVLHSFLYSILAHRSPFLWVQGSDSLGRRGEWVYTPRLHPPAARFFAIKKSRAGSKCSRFLANEAKKYDPPQSSNTKISLWQILL